MKICREKQAINISQGILGEDDKTIKHEDQDVWCGAAAGSKAQPKLGRVAKKPVQPKSLRERVIDAARFGQFSKLRSLCADGQVASDKELLNDALCETVRVSDPECTGFLLTQGADPNAQRAGDLKTPITIAIRARSLECAQQILAAGADVRIRDSYGMTPLLDATFTKDHTPQGNEILTLIEDANIKARRKVRMNRQSLL